MQKTFKGKIYDTEKMTVVKKVVSGAWGDPAGYEETLYQEGNLFFMYTNGGEQSPYKAAKLVNMPKSKAQAWLEK